MKLAVAMVLTAGLATPAFAQDSGWQGFHIGAFVAPQSGYVYGVSTNTSFAYSGTSIGASAGYDWYFEPVVVGLTADFATGSLSYTSSSSTVSLESFGTLRGRVGIPIDRFLPYLTAGIAIGSGRGEVPFISFDERRTHFGSVIGLGVEAKVTDNISITAEALSVRLVEADYATAAFPSASAIAHGFGAARFGVNLRF